jgi:DNA polymerase-3 subunit delta
MKRTYTEHLKAKDRNCLGRWCLLTGAEQHLKRELLSLIREQAAKASGKGEEPSWETLDASTVTAREILNRCQTGALFGGPRVLVVREVERLAAKEQDSLAKGVGALPADVTVVLVAGEGGDRRRSVRPALSRAVSKEGLVVDFPALKAADAAAWAVKRAKALGKKLEPAAARKLVDQKVGTGLGEIETELEKLVLFVGERGAIAAAHVDAVTPRTVEEDIFRLLDAVGRREPGRAAAILRSLLADKREQPGRVLWMLARQIRLIWQTKLLLESGWQPGKEVAEETAALLPQEPAKNALAQFGRRTWLARRTAQQAKALSWGQLYEAIRALHACDLTMKGIRGKVQDQAVALELLVVQLCTGLKMPMWESEVAGRAPLGSS